MSVRKLVVPGIIVALLAAAAVVMFQGEERKTLTAHFPRTVSIYEGSDVRVLGVPVGTVDTVTPSGTDVVVTMSYDAETEIPADAEAVIIAPSIVGDRFVQLTPVYEEGEVLADGATLTEDQTAVPLELDQIYSSMDELTVALGPTGANRNGALSDLLETTAENFGGQGEQFHQTIQDFSKFTQTLDRNKEELFGSAAALEGFISTLAENDQTVRQFNQSLGDVADHARGGARRAEGVAEQPRGRDGRGLDLRRGEPRDPRPQHRGPQPGREGAGQAAGCPRRDPPRRSARAEQPLPDLQPAGRHARHPHQPWARSSASSRTTRPRSCAASSARPTPPDRSATRSRRPGSPACRAPRPSARAVRRPRLDRFDPTLGGLVEVER